MEYLWSFTKEIGLGARPEIFFAQKFPSAPALAHEKQMASLQSTHRADFCFVADVSRRPPTPFPPPPARASVVQTPPLEILTAQSPTCAKRLAG